MNRSKFIGGILLIVGTSIGGGMLALPLATSESGFIYAVASLIVCWLVMTAGALLILEVNMRLPLGSNMISMATMTLGWPGKIIAWITYLFLLYTLLAAYISGGSDIFIYLFHKLKITCPSWLGALVFTCFFGFIVYAGITVVDYANRGLMIGKLGIYFLLLIIIFPYTQKVHLQNGYFDAINHSLLILITSFGFATIIPSLREYFQDDIVLLRRVVIIGSFIPLICYIAWIATIMGTIPRSGSNGLIALISSAHPTSDLAYVLRKTTSNAFIGAFFDLFTSICMLTAFLGVSLGLFDFIADGVKLKKQGLQGKIVWVLTFVPPLIIVLFHPGIYLIALSYAGLCCIVLLLLLPVIMAWQARKLSQNLILLPGGNLFLLILGIIALTLLAISY